MTVSGATPPAGTAAGAFQHADRHLAGLQAANLRSIALFSAAAMAFFCAASLVQGFDAMRWQYFSIAALSALFAAFALGAVRLNRRGRRIAAPAVLFGAAYCMFVVSSLLVNDRNLLFSGKILVVLNLLGVILTVPPRHLGRACILCLLGGLALAAI